MKFSKLATTIGTTALLCLTTTSAWAVFDPPGPPAITAGAYIKPGKLVPLTPGGKIDYECCGDEWGLAIIFDHQGHKKRAIKSRGITNPVTFPPQGNHPGLPFSDEGVDNLASVRAFETYEVVDQPGGRQTTIAKQTRYTEVECTPRSPLLAYMALVETDIDSFGAFTVNAMFTAIGLINIPAGIIAGAASLTLTNFLPVFIDDDYGAGVILVPINGDATLPLRGADGAADMVVEGRTTPAAGGANCAPPAAQPPPGTTPPSTKPPPNTGTRQSYNMQDVKEFLGTTEQLYAFNASYSPELIESNPDVQSILKSYRVYSLMNVVSMARSTALSLMDIHQKTAGVQAAMDLYKQGLELESSKQYGEALALFKQSAYKTMEHSEEPQTQPSIQLNPELIATPRYIVSPAGNPIQIGGKILGLKPTQSVQSLGAISEGLAPQIEPAGPKLGVALAADINDNLKQHNVIGLKRVKGAKIAKPNSQCNSPHLVSHSFIAIDDVETLPPADSPCGLGVLVETDLPLQDGGVPKTSTYTEHGYELNIDTRGVAPGKYSVRLKTHIADETGETKTIHLDIPVILL